MRTIGTADRVRRAMTNRLKPEIVVGFDSEWVDASHADEGIPPNALNLTLDARLRIGFSRLYARVEKGALDCPAPSDHRFRFRQSIPKHQYSSVLTPSSMPNESINVLNRVNNLLGPVQIGIAAGHLLHGSRIRRPLRGRTASGGCGSWPARHILCRCRQQVPGNVNFSG